MFRTERMRNLHNLLTDMYTVQCSVYSVHNKRTYNNRVVQFEFFYRHARKFKIKTATLIMSQTSPSWLIELVWFGTFSTFHSKGVQRATTNAFDWEFVTHQERQTIFYINRNYFDTIDLVIHLRVCSLWTGDIIQASSR